MITVIFGGFGAWETWKNIKAGEALSWPEAQGTILEHKTDRVSRRRRPDDFRPACVYGFEVDGERYTGSRYCYAGLTLPAFDTVDEAMRDARRRWPLGSTHPVYYNPKDPSECELERGKPDWMLAGIFGGIAALCGGIAAVRFMRSRG